MRAAAGTGHWVRASGVVLAVLLHSLALSACDGRARAIRSRLSDAELLRFDLGQKLSSPCWSCHDFYGDQNKVGPYLSGVFGRPAAAATFPGYSASLRASGIVWERDTLRRYLFDPEGLVPGTSMASPGVRGRVELDAILFYMEQVTR